MKLGISTASFFTKAATEDTFEYIRAMGADTCEVYLSSFCEYSGSLTDEIVAKRCLPVHSIHTQTTQYEPELFSKNPRACNDANGILDMVLDTGKRLGARYYTFHGATALKKISYNFDYERISRVVGGIIDKCAMRDMYLSYETVHWAFFNTPHYFEELKRRCPTLHATLDVKQIMQAGHDWHDYLSVIGGDKLATVHLCDYDADHRLYLPGRGTFDFVELFRTLRDCGFDGALMMEVYPEGYKDYKELASSFDYLRECMDKM